MYRKTIVDKKINVEAIATMYYFKFAKEYLFKGEKHDFWELTYVDKGQAEILIEDKGYRLYEGDIVFNKPNEFHMVLANGKIKSDLIVIGFYCNSIAMNFFQKKIFNIKYYDEEIIKEIIKEGNKVFLNIEKRQKELIKKSNSIFGGEQIIGMNLERLFISLIRENARDVKKMRLSTAVQEKIEDELADEVAQYLKDNLYKKSSLEDIDFNFSIDYIQLQNLFIRKMGVSIKGYVTNLKIEEGKTLIKEGSRTLTEIADMLGFNSINYFSKTFKKYTDMTPTQYAKIVKNKGTL